jgi:hypothetical protein
VTVSVSGRRCDQSCTAFDYQYHYPGQYLSVPVPRALYMHRSFASASFVSVCMEITNFGGRACDNLIPGHTGHAR